MIRALLRRLKPHLLGLRRDRTTGHLFYPVDGIRHFVRFPAEAQRRKQRRLQFERLFFREYLPRGTDRVVDVGAGLGTEIIPLARIAPGLRYIAVEIQPWVFECLCLTLSQLPAGFVPFPLAIGPDPETRIQPTRAGDDAHCLDGTGAVPVQMVGWEAFLQRHDLEHVDLLKMNIEGAEADLLDHVNLDQVSRVLVAVHDFRADRGEGVKFRTRARVTQRLESAGFSLTDVGPDWIYAFREQ